MRVIILQQFLPPKKPGYYSTNSFFLGEKIIASNPTPLGGPPLVSTWMEVSRPCCYSLGSSIAPAEGRKGFSEKWIFGKIFHYLGGWSLTHLNNMLVKKKYLKLVHIIPKQKTLTSSGFLLNHPPFFEVAEFIFCPEWIMRTWMQIKTDHEDHDVEYDDAYRSDWFGYCDDHYPLSTV